MYPVEEQVDMILIYGECQQNSVRAKILYSERYPNNKTNISWIDNFIIYLIREYYLQASKKTQISLIYGVISNPIVPKSHEL